MDNRVEIIVGARDMTRADLDSLKARLDEFGRRVATAKVDVNDKAAQASLLRLAAQFDRLNRRVTPEMDLKGFARAEVQLAAMERSLDRLGGASGTGGLLASVTGGLSSMSAALPGGAAGFAALAGGAAALALALAPVAAAMIPVTIGFTGFAFLAKSEVSKIFTALTAQGKALTTALKGMSPEERAVYREAEPLKDSFGKLQKAIQPEILKAFGDGIRILRSLMPALQPLVIAAGKALDAFLKSMADWLKSPSGQAFVKWLETRGPADIKTFGKVMWDTAHAVGDALDFIYNWGKFVDNFFKNLFTIWVPKSADILKNSLKITFDQIVLHILGSLLQITTAFGHLPGPMGEPFRIASGMIRGEMNKIQGDVKGSLNSIQNDINALHGKNVSIGFGLSGSVAGEGNLGPIKKFAAGTSGAGPGWAWVGERGPELVKMRGGETVIPNHALRGYAGGVLNFSDAFHPSAGAFDRALNSAASSVENALAAFVRRKFASFGGGGGGGASGGSGGSIEALARRMFPWPSFMWTDFTLVENREAGWNMRARNPSSGAYGLAQFINGPSEYYQWGGNPNTAAGQLAGMFNYIRSRYGDPLRAWGHEMSFGWYAGGTRNARPGLAVVGERGPELVGHGPLTVALEIHGGHGPFEAALAEILRRYVRVRGGNVQSVFGRN